MLSTTTAGHLTWTWDGADPFWWKTEYSDDGISGWTFFEFVPGADREDDTGTTPFYYRIIGTNSVHVPVTDYSNVVYASG